MSPILFHLPAAFNIADHFFLEKNFLASVMLPLWVFLLHCWTLLSLLLVSDLPPDLRMLESPRSQMQPFTLATHPYSPPGFKYHPCGHDVTLMSLALCFSTVFFLAFSSVKLVVLLPADFIIHCHL